MRTLEINGEIYSVEKLRFPEILSYWKEVNHFDSSHGPILHRVDQLGDYKNKIEIPRQVSYGLFHKTELIGCTMLVEWNIDWVRYRTINIRENYRGNDLGWILLRVAYEDSWSDRHIFGWVKENHMEWSLRKGFKKLNSTSKHDHIGMLLNKNEVPGINF